MRNNQSRNIFIVLTIITGCLMSFGALQSVYVARDYQVQRHNTKIWAEQQTDKVAKDLSHKIRQISDIAEQLAIQLDGSTCNPCDIESRLRSTYLQHTGFLALGAAFNAGESGTAFRLYAPFIQQNSPGAKIERLDSYYDYLGSLALENTDLARNAEAWYYFAQARPQQWIGPFYEAALGRQIIRYTTPIYNAQGHISGLAYIDASLDWLHEQIEKYDFKDNNYVLLHTAEGQELYRSLKKVTEKAQVPQPDKTTTNLLTHVAAWQNSSIVSATEWKLTSVVSKRTPAGEIDSVGKNEPDALAEPWYLFTKDNRVGWVCLLTLITILSYACWHFRRRRIHELQLWIDAGIYTLIFFTGIICIWVLEYGAINAQRDKIVTLTNKAIIEKYERDHALDALAAHEDAPIYIPVGLFIQSIEFLSATNVNITGYIWHKYQAGQASDYKVGTIFPESIGTKIELAYEKTTDKETVKGWYFETTLRENFTPDRYPFDRQSVWIRLWHENLGDNIVLIPDLNAYDNLDTRALPGIEKDFVLSGWSLFRSYFDMHAKEYNTHLGNASDSSKIAVPELYFNIEIMRNVINPFLAHLFPLLVVVLMLYAIVITMSTDEHKKDFLGFNAAGVVASCSGLFFVALISHVQMRDELKANSVVYLEYFYLITYVIILLITTNAILLSLKVPLRFIQFHDNLWPKLLYWPAISGALFLCTAWQFSR